MTELHAVDNELSWQDRLYDELCAQDIRIMAYVPDAGHKTLINRSLADPDTESIALTTEEEGVALLAGADLGGKRSVLLMQSSGLGNCVNFFSLVKAGHFPMLMILSMRGDFGEGNPWQYPMGQAVKPICDAMGIITFEVDRPQDVIGTAKAAITSVYGAGNAVAVLLTQKLLGAKTF